MEHIGKKIKTLRQKKEWNQAEAAKRLNLATLAFCKIETGKTRMTISRLRQICNVFEVSAIDLLTDNFDTVKYGIEVANNYRLELSRKTADVISLQKKIISLYEEINTRKACTKNEDIEECVAEYAV